MLHTAPVEGVPGPPRTRPLSLAGVANEDPDPRAVVSMASENWNQAKTASEKCRQGADRASNLGEEH